MKSKARFLTQYIWRRGWKALTRNEVVDDGKYEIFSIIDAASDSEGVEDVEEDGSQSEEDSRRDTGSDTSVRISKASDHRLYYYWQTEASLVRSRALGKPSSNVPGKLP